LNQEWLISALTSLGLKRADALVYVFLAKTGPQKVKATAGQLGMHKQKVYCSLKRLQSKGYVKAILEHPALFSAVPLKKILDTLIDSRIAEAENIQQNKQELLSIWQSMTTGNSTT
jgi:sugar-specific transcriptional regulator TrmB